MVRIREYHYVMTFQFPDAATFGLRTDTYQGVMEWYGDEQDAYWQVFNDGCAELRFPPTKSYVLFWSFKPNKLEP